MISPIRRFTPSRFTRLMGACLLTLMVGVAVGLSGCGGSGSANTPLNPFAVTTNNTSPLPIGVQQQFSSTNTATWVSSNPAVVSINASTGVATGVAVGTATLTATDTYGETATAPVTVNNASLLSITVAPLNATLGTVNAIQQYTATGAFSDNTTHDLTIQVTWASSNTNCATFTGTGTLGLLADVGAGTATITATWPLNTSISASTPVTTN